nr:proprotein convertase P-domain-containing protein [Fimbriimonadaceae bacterium]
VVVPLNVGFNQKITRVVLGLEVVHAFPQDLAISLHDPRSHGVWVWNQQPGAGGISANVVYNDFNGKPSNGLWQLWARDVFFGDQGAVTKCELTIYYDAYKTVTTVVTGANGTYQFTNLAPAFYRIYPSMTGQTFTPAVRAVTVGPSRTGQDFTRN